MRITQTNRQNKEYYGKQATMIFLLMPVEGIYAHVCFEYIFFVLPFVGFLLDRLLVYSISNLEQNRR